jgi:hypothetical protein
MSHHHHDDEHQDLQVFTHDGQKSIENEIKSNFSRRHFLKKGGISLGAMALAGLMGPQKLLAGSDTGSSTNGVLGQPHFTPKVKRVIYLFQSGAPSQFELFDHKPILEKMHGEDIPPSVRGNQRLTGMTAGQRSFPLAGSMYKFDRYGQSGASMSELLPNLAEIVDELTFIRSMHTEAINHDPAVTFFQTGSQIPGRPCIGSWLSYGLGTDNEDLPAFMVLLSRGSKPSAIALNSRLWGNGFLPSIHQGVQLRAGEDPVLYLNNPDGVSRNTRRNVLNKLGELAELQYNSFGDPEILSNISQYEMAYRMQASVPEIADLSDEPEETFELYGPESKKPGTYAANCIMARRLIEKDVKFVQLYHMGWDQHYALNDAIQGQAYDVDQPSAALIKDLKRRGLLEDTLVIFGGEFGRTSYCQGKLTKDLFGRDHHPRAFTMWMAGAGIKPGMSYGETDEFGYNVIQNPVHVHDFQATLLHLLGIAHERLTFKHQGRRFRLTDVHGEIIKSILA